MEALSYAPTFQHIMIIRTVYMQQQSRQQQCDIHTQVTTVLRYAEHSCRKFGAAKFGASGIGFMRCVVGEAFQVYSVQCAAAGFVIAWDSHIR
jgi:hypothetical protein